MNNLFTECFETTTRNRTDIKETDRSKFSSKISLVRENALRISVELSETVEYGMVKSNSTFLFVYSKLVDSLN